MFELDNNVWTKGSMVESENLFLFPYNMVTDYAFLEN